MALHCQLLFTTILYAFVFLCSLLELAIVAFVRSSLDGTCFLFVKFRLILVDKPSHLPCNFIIYAFCALAIYSLVMAVYHGYGTVVASRESHIGRTMWVMPWLLLNALSTVLTFISASVYSVGFYMTCQRASDTFSSEESCEFLLRHSIWYGTKPDTFKSSTFQSMSAAEILAWLCFVTWCGLIALEAIRLFRNRRARAQDIYLDPSFSDTVRIGDMPPSS